MASEAPGLRGGVTLLAALGWMSYRRLVELREAARSVEQTLRVRSAADVLLSLIKDAETGQRGFLVTGDASYLQPYKTAVASIPERFDRLSQLTIENRSQQERLAALHGLIRQKLDELAATILAYRSGGPAAAARTVLGGEDKQVMGPHPHRRRGDPRRGGPPSRGAGGARGPTRLWWSQTSYHSTPDPFAPRTLRYLPHPTEGPFAPR
jgi:hypothetical protein